MMSTVRRIAVAQMTSTADVAHNFTRVESFFKQAREAGCSLISLPECFEWIGSGPADSLKFAMPLSSPLFTRYRDLCKRFSMWAAFGGFHERASPDSERISNTHVLVSDLGEIVAKYEKIHMFDVDIPDGKFFESSFTQPGNTPVLVTHVAVGGEGTATTATATASGSGSGEGINIGMTTCYDLRFPMLFACLRSAGANLFLVPSAFMRSTGEMHWESLLRARAIETQSYVAAAAQVGSHNEKRSSFGHSMIIDPWGRVLAQMDGAEEGIITADIDPTLVESVRAKMPVINHWRTDIYGSMGASVRVVHAGSPKDREAHTDATEKAP